MLLVQIKTVKAADLQQKNLKNSPAWQISKKFHNNSIAPLLKWSQFYYCPHLHTMNGTVKLHPYGGIIDSVPVPTVLPQVLSQSPQFSHGYRGFRVVPLPKQLWITMAITHKKLSYSRDNGHSMLLKVIQWHGIYDFLLALDFLLIVT